MTKHISNAADRAALASKGFTWATVQTRGENKGRVISSHKSYDAANKAAKNKDRTIVEIAEGGSF